MKKKRQLYAIQSHRQLYECIKNTKQSGVNLDSWNKLIDLHLKRAENENFCEDKDTTLLKQTNTDNEKQEQSYLTLGCCGFPNVGKSSLLNTLVGRKVVSVSRTPGKYCLSSPK